jgi:hypothetical protein
MGDTMDGHVCDEKEQEIDINAGANGVTYDTEAAARAAGERAVRKIIRRKGAPCNEITLPDNIGKGQCIRIGYADEIARIVHTFAADATVNEEDDEIPPRWSWVAEGKIKTRCMWFANKLV